MSATARRILAVVGIFLLPLIPSMTYAWAATAGAVPYAYPFVGVAAFLALDWLLLCTPAIITEALSWAWLTHRFPQYKRYFQFAAVALWAYLSLRISVSAGGPDPAVGWQLVITLPVLLSCGLWLMFGIKAAMDAFHSSNPVNQPAAPHSRRE